MTDPQVSTTWDEAATAYDRLCTSLSEDIAQQTLRKLGVKSGEAFLDVASGSGAVTLTAAGLGADVTAVDFSAKMVERLKANCQSRDLRGVTTAIMDGQNLELDDASYDVAVSAFGLTFFPDLTRGFAELHRVLRPGGRAGVLADAPSASDPLSLLFGKALSEVLGDIEGGDEIPVAQRLAQPGAMDRHLRDAGFHDVEVEMLTIDWPIASVPEFWGQLGEALPTVKPLFEMLGPEKSAEVGEAFGRLIESDADGNAHVGIAVLLGTGRK